jgi:nucleotide-binding universal stress UspA family protein
VTKSKIPAGSIVVGADGSEHSDRAVTWAARQASRERRPLVILHSCDQITLRDTRWLDVQGIDHVALARALRSGADALLTTVQRQAALEAPDIEIQAHVVDADPRDALIDASGSAELVVVGSRGRGPLRSLVLGSVSTAVARHAVSPVVVCRPPGTPAGRARVLVGADGTPSSVAVIEFAFRQASLRHLPLTVMHCFFDVVTASNGPQLVAADDRALGPELDEFRLLLAESVAGLREKFPDVPVDLQLARGLVDECLLDQAPSAELIVVGRRHARGLDRFLYASCALAVLERATTTVAVVPENDPSEDSLT